ncbi:cysteine-rich venom protein 6-like [Topomyia yanbarensis]|uniref:cysteine-rich venom protein 6-like n=1 Tax=Topomyia yanbarensis TaxID=2498891 RepID=UPI00273CA9AF|nr:cysteine-rich venom protein 6-like [Topomyia yanbarensis]
MKLTVVTVIVAMCAAFVHGVPYDTVCSGVNEIFQTCGSACPATCDSYRYQESRWCGVSCQRGCFCRSGYVRNAIGAWVEPIQCTGPRNYLQPYGYNYGPVPIGSYGYGNVLPEVVATNNIVGVI